MFQPFILILQLIALPAISLAGHGPATQQGFDPTNLLFVPASLLGTMAGLLLYKGLTDQQFFKAVNILLVVSELSLVL